MQQIYFDNGSTSFPKAPNVAEEMFNTIKNGCFNVNRGGYSGAYDLENKIFETREKLCNLFNFNNPANVIFTNSITHSLNYVIKGLLKSGDHIIVSSMEHNAMIRPLVQASQNGVEFDQAQCNIDGTLDIAEVEKLIKPNTKAIMMLHASNVCGTVLPIKKVGELCKKHNLIFVVDSAQTAGVFPIDMEDMNIDILCFTGHKSLRGPQGIGGFLIKENLIDKVTPLIAGGTGSFSDSEVMPSAMPDRFEAGTMNIPGIIGLNTALTYLNEYGMANIAKEEETITKAFLDGIKTISGIRIVGKQDLVDRAYIVSLDFLEDDNANVAYRLEQEYGVMTRCGLHCAPRAHKTLNTFPYGTVRFAFSHFNTLKEVDICIDGIKAILR